MSIEFSAAFIAALTSLSVAFIGLVASILSQRQSIRSQKEIEQLKFQLSRSNSQNAISNRYLSERVKSLQRAIKVIQQVKDHLQIIISADDASLDSDIALEEFVSLRKNIFLSYENKSAHLEEESRSIFHRAKNLTHSIELFLIKRLQSGPFTSCLTYEERDQLSSWRNELTEIQNSLRDRRESFILEVISFGD